MLKLNWVTVAYISSSFYCLRKWVWMHGSNTHRNLEREHSNVKFFWLNSWSISNANWQRMLFQHHLPSAPELPTTAIQLQVWVKASLLCCCWWYRLQDSHVIWVVISDIYTLYEHHFCLNISFSSQSLDPLRARALPFSEEGVNIFKWRTCQWII